MKCKLLSRIVEEVRSMCRSSSTFVKVNLESCDGLGRAGKYTKCKEILD